MPEINNRFYNDLGDNWYEGSDHPIALLRAEAPPKLTYVEHIIGREKIRAGSKVLDLGCGGGLVSNPLADSGLRVVGVDASENAIETARRYAPRDSPPDFRVGDVYQLAFEDQTFDVVLMLDLLEHLEEPAQAIREAGRVLRPEGVLVFHTFNRTWLANCFAVKGIHLFKNTPPNVHVYSLFIKPKELARMGQAVGLTLQDLSGIRPVFSKAFFRSLLSRKVHPDFRFRFTKSLQIGYMGYFMKASG